MEVVQHGPKVETGFVLGVNLAADEDFGEDRRDAEFIDESFAVSKPVGVVYSGTVVMEEGPTVLSYG